MKSKKNNDKMVKKHLKDDMKDFKKEIKEDKSLVSKLSKKKK